ncbi:MAG: hypothetical protein ACPG49_03945 [Chitinophagales bacterium]
MKSFKALLLLCLFFSFSLSAQDTTAIETKSKKIERVISPEELAANDLLFDSEEILELTLTADLKAVKKDIGEKRESHPATITYQNEEGKTIALDLKVKTRGNSRRSKNMCDFPPLRLDFKRDSTRGSLFEGQNKLKLVAHCQDKGEDYKEYVIREHLVYKAYRLLTDKGFRVRLLKMTYVDSGDKDNVLERYGFIIESEKFLAARLGGKMLKNKKIHAENTDRTMVDRVSIFQYMIGNLDWSVKENHNMKMCYVAGASPYCVPYDFDLTGIVNTEYALPPEMLAVNSVRDRLFRGYCRTSKEFEEAFKEFRTVKENLYALYTDSELLSEKYVKSTIKYLDDFYETIDNSKSVKQQFLKKCRKVELRQN